MSISAYYRKVVTLRFLGDMSLQEIAEWLNIPVGTVKSRLNRALSKLREHIAESEQRGVGSLSSLYCSSTEFLASGDMLYSRLFTLAFNVEYELTFPFYHDLSYLSMFILR